jgi:alpha(1,3/1,4) fucosyltransferase
MDDHKQTVAIFVDPPSHHFLRNKLFEVGEAKLGGDDLLAPYRYVREFFQERGITVQTADFLPSKSNGTKNVYISFGILTNYQRLAKERSDTVLSAYFAMECPIVEPRMYKELRTAQNYFKRIFSWSDSGSLERFVGGPLRCERFHWMQSFDDVHDEIWQQTDRKFLVMINANKLPRVYWQELYTERMKAVEYFSRYNEVDLYGKGWESPSIRVGRTRVPYTLKRVQYSLQKKWDKIRPDPLLVAARKAYRGVAESKSRTIGQYKFALCFENSILKGWITEKIFDCFFAGTVPIYWGEPEIEKYIPEECYIDMRKFNSYEDLRAFLHSLSEDDIRNYKESARAFLRSPAFYPFSQTAFAELIRGIVSSDTGVEINGTLGGAES